MKKPPEAYVGAVLAAGCVVMAMLSGCTSGGAPASPDIDKDGGHFQLDLGSGRHVDCWYVESGVGDGQTGGPTCDWQAYHQAYDVPVPGMK